MVNGPSGYCCLFGLTVGDFMSWHFDRLHSFGTTLLENVIPCI